MKEWAAAALAVTTSLLAMNVAPAGAVDTRVAVPGATSGTHLAARTVSAFDDVAGNVHETAIAAVTAAGIAAGYGDGTYRAGAQVTRAQMATFLLRATGAEIVDTDPPFSDVRLDDVHASAIATVTALGIAGGYGDGTYRPGTGVTRAQMATFLVRAADLDVVEAPLFPDVATSDTHAAAIATVTAAGIAGGYADGTYGPGDPVTRGQMATFLARTFLWAEPEPPADPGLDPALDPERPTVTIDELPTAQLGLTYSASLEVRGGTSPYRWQVQGLPEGIEVREAGAVRGAPLQAGAFDLEITVTDARGVATSRQLVLEVEDVGVPATCIGQDCLELAPTPGTIEVPAEAVEVVSRVDDRVELVLDPGWNVPTIGGFLVVEAAEAEGELLIVEVTSSTPASGGGTLLSGVLAGLGAAYAEGAVHLRTATVITDDPAAQVRTAATSDGEVHLVSVPVECELEGEARARLRADVEVDPDAYVEWDLLGVRNAGVHLGLSLEVGADARLEGGVSCDVVLPGLTVVFPTPIGVPGVVAVDPTVAFVASADVGAELSAGLVCTADLRDGRGRSASTSFGCFTLNPALAVDLDEPSAEATLTAGVDARITVSDLVGVTAGFSGGVVGTLTPLEQPTATLGLLATMRLGGCLGCFLGTSAIRGDLLEHTFGPFEVWSTSEPLPLPVAFGDGGEPGDVDGGGTDPVDLGWPTHRSDGSSALYVYFGALFVFPSWVSCTPSWCIGRAGDGLHVFDVSSGLDYLGSLSIAGDDRPPAVILADLGFTEEDIAALLA